MTAPRDFRKQEFTEEQLPGLKRKLISYTEGFFYQNNGCLALSLEDKEVFSKVFNWLIGKVDREKNKGLLITGTIGTGKSVLMKSITQFIIDHYSDMALVNGIPVPYITTAHQLASKYATGDIYEINKMKTTRMLAIDDIGWEPETITDYGTIYHPLQEIIMERYEARRMVLMTSNLTLDQIGERYGAQVKDRLRQMVYLIEVLGESKRN